MDTTQVGFTFQHGPWTSDLLFSLCANSSAKEAFMAQLQTAVYFGNSYCALRNTFLKKFTRLCFGFAGRWSCQ